MRLQKIPLKLVLPLVLVLVLVFGGLLLTRDQKIHVTAYFDQFKGIYVGDDVTVLGVPIGTVTSVEPEPDRVRVEMELSPDHPVPADVKAAVVAPSLVSVRSIILGPFEPSGAHLEDGAVIPESRTAVPVEWDAIKDQLVNLSTALGPHGANGTGSTSNLISSGARFLDGQGATLNSTIRNVSEAMSTLSDNSGDLFATVRNLEVFIAAIKGSDAQVRLFNQRLATVAAALDQDRHALAGALEGMHTAFGEVNDFIRENQDLTISTLRELRSTTSVLAADRQNIADLLQVAPIGISNFYNILDPRISGGPTGELAANNLNSPAQIICGALLALGGDRTDCQAALGPLVKYFAFNAPPVGIGGVTSNGAGEGGTQDPGGSPRAGASTGGGDLPYLTDEAELLSQLLGGQ
jgi:phospholipid/cholesterol/gamma-HCH transport system substrate-binding protein